MIYLGNTNIESMYVGSGEIVKGYLGNNIVFEKQTEIPNYLKFNFGGSGNFVFANWSGYDVDYSFDGKHWTASDANQNIIPVTPATTLYFRGDNYYSEMQRTGADFDFYCYVGNFEDGNHIDVTVSGNIMSMVDKINFENVTTIDSLQFAGMFVGLKVVDCSNLLLPATTLAEQCYFDLFYTDEYNVPKLFTTAPELPATTLAEQCYYRMFNGCSNLNYVKCLADSNYSSINATDSWLNGVSATGTFVKNSSATDWTSGASGIPSGWTVQNA